MIVVAGEALVDLTAETVGGKSAYVARPGGSPYNVAVGLGRAGVPVAFLGRLSHDRFGQLLRSHLLESRVSLEHVTTGGEPTTLAVVHSSSDQPEYSFYSDGTAAPVLMKQDLPELPSAKALHLGSIALVLEPGASTLEDLMRRVSRRLVISLDPNIRPGLIADRDSYRRRLEIWLELVDVVKVSVEDLAWLEPDRGPLDVTDEWLSRGAVLAIVTMGGEGALAVTPSGSARAPSPAVPVADTVGAGDAFTSAALAYAHANEALSRDALARLGSDDLTRLLRAANAHAADTCTRHGADPPWRAPETWSSSRSDVEL